MTALTKRFEARLDPETDGLIARAAELSRMSKSAFVTRAARAEAERVVARADITWLAPEVYDALIDSLGTPDEAPELAAKLARLPKIS
ncbi:hypothetical protein GCM10009668_25860 [Nocardioides dubius]|uniref:DUF1778 domain-containing protein n=1 Tax=Nocardioides dubius TaxID=317019 RepID=A0ABP4EH51_9ACTN